MIQKRKRKKALTLQQRFSTAARLARREAKRLEQVARKTGGPTEWDRAHFAAGMAFGFACAEKTLKNERAAYAK